MNHTQKIVHVGQLPAGPMQDRRTKRLRSRNSQRRHAIAQSVAS